MTFNILKKNISANESVLPNAKLAVKKLSKNLISCPQCAKDLAFNASSGLSICRCPQCSAPVFVPLKVKDYWLCAPAGGGGMGSVYRGFIEGSPDIDVAVKVLPRNKKQDQELIERLSVEAMVGFSFGTHPHLVKVVDFGLADDEHFIAMEYIEGERLDRLISREGAKNEKQILLWALQLLSAEQHIYDRGFLFRDLKPQNIIIDRNKNLKLFDFGLAIPVKAARNGHMERLSGSPFYMPPERISGGAEEAWSEIYSMGMVLFHMLAGTTYYSADEIKTLIGKHIKALRVNDVSSKLPQDTDPEFVRILNRMIDRDPVKRYQSYQEAASDIYKVFKHCA